MGRPKKDSCSLNVHIESKAYEQLKIVSEYLGQTKTTVVERAILEYAKKYGQAGNKDKNEVD